MGKYGNCENCGSTMEVVGCPSCDELAVIEMIDSYPDESEVYERWKG